MNEDFETLRKILLGLFDLEKSLWSSPDIRHYQELYHDMPPMYNENEIKNLMDYRTGDFKSDFRKSSSFLYLPPFERDSKFIPILVLDCDLNPPASKISFYITLYKYVGGERHPKCIGFRFEGSHGGPVHDFCHVQIINKIKGTQKRRSLKCYDWLPTTVPCIPVKARCPVSLFLLLLVSFYGKGILNMIQVELADKYKEPLDGILSCAT
jgi:hypothetical protein